MPNVEAISFAGVEIGRREWNRKIPRNALSARKPRVQESVAHLGDNRATGLYIFGDDVDEDANLVRSVGIGFE